MWKSYLGPCFSFSVRLVTSPPRGQTIQLLAVWLFLPSCSAVGEVQRWVRFEDGGKPSYGLVTGEDVQIIAGEPWNNPQPTGRTLPTKDLVPLVPVQPQLVLGAAYNYRSHLADRTAPTKPQFFWKTPQCLLAHGQPIELPASALNAHFEAELVIVVGEKVEHATLDEAEAAIFGYTCGNDISERDWSLSDVQWWRAKASRTFGPLGPEIVSGLDWKTLRVRGIHNGVVAQDEAAADLLFSPAELLQHASQFVTLHPGDVIYTGSPGKTAALKSGDEFTVEINGVGTLRNPVIAEPAQ